MTYLFMLFASSKEEGKEKEHYYCIRGVSVSVCVWLLAKTKEETAREREREKER